MKQQTAVEWLEERFDKYIAWRTGDHKATEYTYQDLVNDFDKARQMEKEQIINAHTHLRCINNQTMDCTLQAYEKAEQYYSETYNPNT
jgi:hypothetical protein